MSLLSISNRYLPKLKILRNNNSHIFGNLPVLLRRVERKWKSGGKNRNSGIKILAIINSPFSALSWTSVVSQSAVTHKYICFQNFHPLRSLSSQLVNQFSFIFKKWFQVLTRRSYKCFMETVAVIYKIIADLENSK